MDKGNSVNSIKMEIFFIIVGGGLMGLADAKWAIEHFSDFIEYVKKHNELPKAYPWWA
jgi:hypothetical protein